MFSMDLSIFASNIKRICMENLNRIKGALADAGKTGVWLARQLGKDPVTVSKWSTNTTQPDLHTMAKISEILQVNIRELLVNKNF